MCKKCHNESDDDYDGSSIAAMRQKAVASVVQRHPELGLTPEQIQFRFVPKYKWQCVRVNLNTDTPRYEIHVREAMGPAMAGGPPLDAIAQAAFIESKKSYGDICDILEIQPSNHLDALFFSGEPPVNVVRVQRHGVRYEYDQDVTKHHEQTE